MNVPTVGRNRLMTSSAGRTAAVPPANGRRGLVAGGEEKAMLPDIGVFGSYTYLVTEALFGTAAVILLFRAQAFRNAGRTILALYPIAFVWDWYTLKVGVFSIELRSGVDLLGIPIEEHLFIVVVSAFIVGIHETVNDRKTD